MPRIIVEVMPKAELLDPQGQAVQSAMGRLGFSGVVSVRQGKRFEIEVDGQITQERRIEIEHLAETLLANPVIEDHTLTIE
ncbi:MAG: phosphoribosylformylglycinamidine synthase subunit PurS [Actinobacteria bacterium]|nr:phosphoribosylformylglycinamidine synthase subunit PurS [Actinomycetota bacterium]MCB8996740.1 phosphoribosylformylglycinamidine synthase subunit PurS [Actinomycetota bacterium]MCB9415071.1 phosphoribosylformylglycinamidine synthase subunit PurS [Actinomycetota bacterium]MCB9425117.1 phosphoribosylformylglycinamidine synthase subunit PurS [Actinomycetota bacterium]HRY11296.1 phosphoribosylformylglycinamidine synthase subunit PurS [Candidatus Nanopelagicales bacterium]